MSRHEVRVVSVRIALGDMPDTVGALVLDLLEWIGPDSRPYAEVLDAWRTSYPRLTVWEDANDLGYVAIHNEFGLGRVVSVSVRAGNTCDNTVHQAEQLFEHGPNRAGQGLS